jgi:hypothetical protein
MISRFIMIKPKQASPNQPARIVVQPVGRAPHAPHHDLLLETSAFPTGLGLFLVEPAARKNPRGWPTAPPMRSAISRFLTRSRRQQRQSSEAGSDQLASYRHWPSPSRLRSRWTFTGSALVVRRVSAICGPSHPRPSRVTLRCDTVTFSPARTRPQSDRSDRGLASRPSAPCAPP